MPQKANEDYLGFFFCMMKVLIGLFPRIFGFCFLAIGNVGEGPPLVGPQ